MASGNTMTNNGLNLALKRIYGVTVTAVSKFGIGTGTTTPAATDSALTTAITAWSGGSDYKNFVTGYPVYDTTNRSVTIRGLIATSEANGNNISETGEFNTDGTVIMIDHDVFTAITKDNQTQISLVWRHIASTT